LHGKTLRERVEALIASADPKFRDELHEFAYREHYLRPVGVPVGSQPRFVALLYYCRSVLLDFGRLLVIATRSRRALTAENLFLRKQLALFHERKVKPRRADDSTRCVMATLSRIFVWRGAL
jgi:hypothetical protein